MFIQELVIQLLKNEHYQMTKVQLNNSVDVFPELILIMEL